MIAHRDIIMPRAVRMIFVLAWKYRFPLSNNAQANEATVLTDFDSHIFFGLEMNFNELATLNESVPM